MHYLTQEEVHAPFRAHYRSIDCLSAIVYRPDVEETEDAVKGTFPTSPTDPGVVLITRSTLERLSLAGFYLLPMAVRNWAPRGQTPVLRVKLTRDHLSAISGTQ